MTTFVGGLTNNSYAETDIWARARYHDEKLDEMYKEHMKMYKMISKMCIKVLGYDEYKEIILSPDKEATNER